MDLRLHIPQIVSRNQRRRENGPQAEVRAVFVRGHSAVADFEHVGIVPVAGAGITLESILQVEDVHHAELVVVFALPLVA